MRLLTIAAMVALLLVAVASEASGKGGTVITTCGQTVTTNAVLGQDLNCPTGSGVIVSASGITINLNGHRITGAGDDLTFGIDDGIGTDRVTVENGTVSEFQWGIYANNADHFTLKNVVSTGNSQNGVQVNGDAASITSVTASGNNGGLTVFGDDALVKSSTVIGNTGGISITGDGAKLTSVNASGNSFAGIFITGDDASIKSSTAAGNGNEGIEVDGEAAKLNRNAANGNGYTVHDHVGLGLVVSYVTTPPVGKNTAAGNDDPEECNLTFLC